MARAAAQMEASKEKGTMAKDDAWPPEITAKARMLALAEAAARHATGGNKGVTLHGRKCSSGDGEQERLRRN